MNPNRELPVLKALTLKRPWSDAIARGPKRIENRQWVPQLGLIGMYFAVHAGAKYEDLIDYPTGWLPPPDPPKGIVAVARLVAILDRRNGGRLVHAPRVGAPITREEEDRIRFLDRNDGWWAGPCGFVLDEVVAIEPVDCQGALGFWNVPSPAANKVRERWLAARRARAEGGA